MRLINVKTLLFEEFYSSIPAYAILSHCWGDDEVSFKDWQDDFASAQRKKGYTKIRGACAEASALGFEYLWCDTNCIDKSSSAELSEAINSMFDLYCQSGVCLAYLDDAFGTLTDLNSQASFFQSRWFARGWTLQELLAPQDVRFYSKGWEFLGLRTKLADSVSRATGIDSSFLQSGTPSTTRGRLDEASVAMRMSWASRRSTTRVEDMAYCMLGIFDINMPLLYGEGTKAFQRLQEEIIRATNDMTLFCWHWDDDVPQDWRSILAPSPKAFIDSGGYIENPTDDGANDSSTPYNITNVGLSIRLPVISVGRFGLALLNVCHPGPLPHCPEATHFRGRSSVGRFTTSPFALLLLHPQHLGLSTHVYVRSCLIPLAVPRYIYRDLISLSHLRGHDESILAALPRWDMHIAFRPTHLRAARGRSKPDPEQEEFCLSQHDLHFDLGVMFILSDTIYAIPDKLTAAKNILALQPDEERDKSTGWSLGILPIFSTSHNITIWVGFAATGTTCGRPGPVRQWFAGCLGFTAGRVSDKNRAKTTWSYKRKMAEELLTLEKDGPHPDRRLSDPFRVRVDIGPGASIIRGERHVALAHIVITHREPGDDQTCARCHPSSMRTQPRTRRLA